MAYAARIHTIERLIGEIERSDDVEHVMTMHSQVEEHLKACQSSIERAQGRLEELGGVADKGA